MCIKFFTMKTSVIFWLILSLVYCNIEERFSDGVQHPVLDKLVKIRCTRRFSPGVCVTNVAPVWTFVFTQQNCTERLGCRNNYRMNRFRSYRMCMKQCYTLVEMYLKLVELEEGHANDTFKNAGDVNDTDDRNLRGGYEYGTASGFQKDSNEDKEEYKEDEQNTKFIVYKDGNVNEDVMSVDIDYVPGEILTLID